MVTVVSVNEDDAIAASATTNYDTQVTVDTSSGATVQPGSMMLLVVRTDKHLELRISSSFDNGGSYSNRGGVEKIPTNGEFRMVMQLVGTNHRIALKNTDAAEATVSVFTSVLS
jgi:hypothetical protein